MKTKLMVWLGVLMLVGSLFTTTGEAKSVNAKKSFVALGDSITYGYNLDNNNHPSNLAYPSIIAQNTDMRLRNLGVPGMSSGQLLNALRTDNAFRNAVKHADVVSLNIGTNDFLQGLLAGNGDPDVLQTYIDPMLQNLGDIVNEIRSLTDAKIIAYNIFNPFQLGDDGLHYYVDYLLSPINTSIQDVISNTGNNVVFADAFNAFEEKQDRYILPEDNHPTPLGHEILAKIGLEALGLQ
ncbi:GDSL-type esterase/lipase family protein [Margalitia sp. FSL K6-0131]|uniref:SGNH/GDSL hydrolase family protein n=1 Tax=Margalitia sp. FSL K6-0131 TaxID=2954604 RepID=UPI0030F7566B